jgi:ribosomal protein S18 acetylase RimI-like enzyme
MLIRRLIPADIEAFVALRLRGLLESPASFASSYDDEVSIPSSAMAERLGPGALLCMLGAFDGDELVGMIGVGRDLPRKVAHKVFLRALYVDARFRKQGVGRALMTHALEHAHAMPGVQQVTLTTTAVNLPALALYEKLGFQRFGLEPRALLIDGQAYDDVHMVRFAEPRR